MYKLTENQTFEISNYQEQAPFSSFLPGIAGVDGIPMWAFYVNRGQGIASFGVQDKNHAMMEFLPADKSYQQVQVQGFRTFIKVIEDERVTFLEPFSPQSNVSDKVEEKMTISENALEVEYVNHEHELKVKVEYFILPEAAVAGLVRQVTLTNLSNKERSYEMLDGLPSLFPSGVPNAAYKELGNTIKSWFDVENLEQNIPFYRLRGSIEDSSEVKEIHQGNFYLSFSRGPSGERMMKPIIDRDVIFGTDTSLHVPRPFITQSIQSLLEEPQQVTTNKVSCGFSAESVELQPGDTLEFHTVIGHAKSLCTVQSYVKEVLTVTSITEMKERAKLITKSISEKIKTRSGQPLFDAYAQQSFLDNGLRGGFPISFENEAQKKVYYLFSRKHGDLERDYNFFSISPTYYSQGNGNYRDINQNRRCDVFFEPAVEDYNVNVFMNLIQLDGYNPLAVKGVRFRLTGELDFSEANNIGSQEKLKNFFATSFTPGELKHFVEEEGIELTTSFESLLTKVLLASEEEQQAEFGEGYWMDHWTYNLDLIDSYLSIYPDKKDDFYFKPTYRFFESPVRVKSRKEKYVVSDGKLRQYHATEKIKEKVAKAADNDGVLWIRDHFGNGEIYQTNLYSKLFVLGLVKVATLAPFGLGVEMEGDKPGWNDSLNGLPGMFGASTSELFELKRLIDLLLKVNGKGELVLPVEVDAFLKNVVSELSTFNSDSDEEELRYWEQITKSREDYRDTIYKGISGEEIVYSLEESREFLLQFKDRVESGIKRAQSYSNPLVPTYFYFEPKGDITNVDIGNTVIEWIPKPVTPFLEGVVKQLKVTEDKVRAEELYQKVKASDIYDRKLGMYKTSMSIEGEPLELGRAKSFTPGWLENESIFLHMEYKYLLATLKAGLIEEFFTDMKSALIPFLDPKMYGRSTLENSSFIASSANPNENLHGRGFVSRLSGSTIEFMNMWFVMMAGEKPFRFDEASDGQGGKLVCQLMPTLPNWMFDENGEVSFTFLGTTEVTYVNPDKKNTYGTDGVTPVSVDVSFVDNASETQRVAANELVGDLAVAIRNGDVSKLVVELR
ncbi:hypothetical protein LGQ02_03390 [Bacillus shivajii]|uniref:hypothetical protein n=1 Tax=Bacillus shivajii TaxID=1983719 RepID=UPI001CFAF453|nr:hypothetical protein [Bacillus shivajii]UCZ53842.1 hypothetical protein LGQ02_03390 [Bacillus shivajii]